MSKEPLERWLLGWMDVELKQEESRANGQGGCSKVGRTTMRVGVNKGPVLIPTRLASHKPATNTQVISATCGASAIRPFDHLTKKVTQISFM